MPNGIAEPSTADCREQIGGAEVDDSGSRSLSMTSLCSSETVQELEVLDSWCSSV